MLSNSNLWTKGFNISARMPSFEKAPVALCILPFIFTTYSTLFTQDYKQFIIIILHSVYACFITLNGCVYYLDHPPFIEFATCFYRNNPRRGFTYTLHGKWAKTACLPGFRGHQRGRLLVQTGDRYPIAIDQGPMYSESCRRLSKLLL